MARVVSWCAALVLIGAAGASASARPVTNPEPNAPVSATADEQMTKVKQALALVQNHDIKGAKSLLAPVVNGPDFYDLAPQVRFAVLGLFALAQIEDRDAAALTTAKRLTAMEDFADGDSWNLRLLADGVASDDADAVASLSVIAKRWPDALSNTDDETVRGLVFRTADVGALADARFDMLAALHQAGWKPADPINEPDYVWFEFARLLLMKGRVEEARAVARPITDHDMVEQMQMQKLFDPITQDGDPRFDSQQVVDRYIQILRDKVKANPNRLEVVNNLALMLTEVGKADEALRMLDAALARSKQGATAPGAFTDTDQINWTYNQRAYTLLALGRIDEALRQMATGAGKPENGGDNVSQQLNLAQMYETVGRPMEAMKVIAGADHWILSAYGRSDYEGVKACASAELGDRAEVAKSIAYLAAHEADARTWLIDALVCANDLDGAAKYVIRELDDPVERIDVLGWFKQEPSPATVPPILKQRDDRITQLYQRPDVRAAIDKVGRRISVPYYSWE